ncbi:cation:proton antiporter (plasmid) [Rhizobium sp. TH2]|uniref:cation:proton antiporter n=1 Tax=Rhizobium sp. TH2 TaxID=2775403 RepID=UPI002156FE24|nr:cation:proton antiporter [Rhizobium sp. TH2]UVC12631.1 cation:proton antiporter [Rhizobium sp. TH2]
MPTYLTLLTLLGATILLTAWLPMVLRRLPLSLPIICIVVGAGLSATPLSPLSANPLENQELTLRFCEFVVIVALMGAGLKLDRPLGWRRWMVTWRLLGIAMPLTIAGIALIAYLLLGVPLPSALLLGAALAPTDPVLASDVQVGPPRSGKEDDVRFSLTSEAGLNDGLSFPFIYLAIALTSTPAFGGSDLLAWVSYDVGWRLAVGILLGWLTGKVLGFLTFRLPKNIELARTGDGLVAIGITCLAYGITEIVHGYGFVAVFVAALTLRSAERHDVYHEHLHDFTEQVERLLMAVLMVFFGLMLGDGTLLLGMTWPIVATALLALFAVRPLAAWVSLVGSPQPGDEKAIIGFFGIRGLGSLYYMAFATTVARFPGEERLWSTVFLVILISVVIHGTTVTPIMGYLDRRRSRDATAIPP